MKTTTALCTCRETEPREPSGALRVATDTARSAIHSAVDLLLGLTIATAAIYWPFLAARWLDDCLPVGDGALIALVRLATLFLLFCAWAVGALLGCMIAAYLFGEFPPARARD